MQIEKTRNGYYLKTIDGYAYVAKTFEELIEIECDLFGEPALDKSNSIKGEKP